MATDFIGRKISLFREKHTLLRNRKKFQVREIILSKCYNYFKKTDFSYSSITTRRY